jgi:protein-tyrosine phosphatase
MTGAVDIHCHLLPGLDDGPANLADSLAMAEAAVSSGTTHMVATPHIDHTWRVRPSTIATRADALRLALREHGIPLQVSTGAEIALSRVVDLSASELDSLRLAGGPYLLLECPLSSTAGDFDSLLLRVHSRGEAIVLAHPERSPLFQQEPERLAGLVAAGMLCSLTASSLRGSFGAAVRRFSIELLREGLVHDISSDAHDHSARPPGLADALAGAEEELPGIGGRREWLTALAPAAILAGEALPAPPPLGGPAP